MQRELILVCSQSLRNTRNKEELLLPNCRGSTADKGSLWEHHSMWIHTCSNLE